MRRRPETPSTKQHRKKVSFDLSNPDSPSAETPASPGGPLDESPNALIVPETTAAQNGLSEPSTTSPPSSLRTNKNDIAKEQSSPTTPQFDVAATVGSTVFASQVPSSTEEARDSLDTVMQDRVSVPAQGSAPDSAFSSTTDLPSQIVPQDAREAQSFPNESISVQQDANTIPSNDPSQHLGPDADTELHARVRAEVLQFGHDATARLDSLSQLEKHTCSQIRLELQAKIAHIFDTSTHFPQGVCQIGDELLPIRYQIERLEEQVRQPVTREESADVPQAAESETAPAIAGDEMEIETHVADATNAPDCYIPQEAGSTALPTFLPSAEGSGTQNDMEGVEHHPLVSSLEAAEGSATPLTTVLYQTQATAVGVPPSLHEDLHHILATRRHELLDRMSLSQQFYQNRCQEVRKKLHAALVDINDGLITDQETLDSDLVRIEDEVQEIEEATKKHASTLSSEVKDDQMADEYDDVGLQLFAGTDLPSLEPTQVSSPSADIPEAGNPHWGNTSSPPIDDISTELLRESEGDRGFEPGSSEPQTSPNMFDNPRVSQLVNDKAYMNTFNRLWARYNPLNEFLRDIYNFSDRSDLESDLCRVLDEWDFICNLDESVPGVGSKEGLQRTWENWAEEAHRLQSACGGGDEERLDQDTAPESPISDTSAGIDNNNHGVSQHDQLYIHPYGPLMRECSTIHNQLIALGSAGFEEPLGDDIQASIDEYSDIDDRYRNKPGRSPDDMQRVWQEWARKAQGLLNQFEAQKEARNANEAINHSITNTTAPNGDATN